MSRKPTFVGVLVLSASFLAANLQAALTYPYEYDFVSSVPGVSGAMFLDSDSSSGGTAADIGPGSYLTFNLGNGAFPSITFSLNSLSTFLDPNFAFAWNSSQITTPIDLAVGLGNSDVSFNRSMQDPNDTIPTPAEFNSIEFSDAIGYYNSYIGAVNGQNGAAVSLITTEETINPDGSVGYIPFDSGSTGQWVALVAVPEPAQIACVASLAALAVALFGSGKKRESVARNLLRNLLRRMPPNRD